MYNRESYVNKGGAERRPPRDAKPYAETAARSETTESRSVASIGAPPIAAGPASTSDPACDGTATADPVLSHEQGAVLASFAVADDASARATTANEVAPSAAEASQAMVATGGVFTSITLCATVAPFGGDRSTWEAAFEAGGTWEEGSRTLTRSASSAPPADGHAPPPPSGDAGALVAGWDSRRAAAKARKASSSLLRSSSLMA